MWAKKLLDKALEQKIVADKFKAQLEKVLTTAAEDSYQHLHQRIEAATTYFAKAIDELIADVKEHAEEWTKKAKTKKYLKDLGALQTALNRKKLQRKTTPAPVEKPEMKKETAKLPKGQTRMISLQRFREGKTVGEIAIERSLSPATIEQHLALFVLTGELDVIELVDEYKLDAITQAIEKTDAPSLYAIKQKLPDDISFGEIRAVLNYRQYLHEKETSA
jgi:uncharacterized protein YpbB